MLAQTTERVRNMNMRSIIWFSVGLLVSTTTMAQPGGPMPDGSHHGHPAHLAPPPHRYPSPHPAPGLMVDILPPGYRTVLFAGLTYFVFNEIWYQLHGGRYEVVAPPPQPVVQPVATNNPYYENGLTRVDINGVRYYVLDGRYYRRTAEGDYLEVPPPHS